MLNPIAPRECSSLVTIKVFRVGWECSVGSALAHEPLKSKRIDDFQKSELIEIDIAGANLPDAVLAHQNCRMSIVEQITGKVLAQARSIHCIAALKRHRQLSSHLSLHQVEVGFHAVSACALGRV